MKRSVHESHFHQEKGQITIETCVRNIPHGVFNGPDDTIHKEFELVRRNSQ